MAISEQFLKYFREFVTKYKTTGKSGTFSWNRELKHDEISKHFSELLVIIEDNQSTFNDNSIIEHLSTTIILSIKTNPYLHDCWADFLFKYNNDVQSYIPFSSVFLNGNPEGKPSEKIIQELQMALTQIQQALTTANQVHQTSQSLISKEVEQLSKKNLQLAEENRKLKMQLDEVQQFKALNLSFQKAQEQLTAVTALIQKSIDLTNDQFKTMDTNTLTASRLYNSVSAISSESLLMSVCNNTTKSPDPEITKEEKKVDFEVIKPTESINTSDAVSKNQDTANASQTPIKEEEDKPMAKSTAKPPPRNFTPSKNNTNNSEPKVIPEKEKQQEGEKAPVTFFAPSSEDLLERRSTLRKIQKPTNQDVEESLEKKNHKIS